LPKKISSSERRKEKILKYLLAGFPSCKVKDFKDIKCTKQYIYKLIKKWKKQGIIEEVYEINEKGKKRKTKPILYGRGGRLTEAKSTKLTSGVSPETAKIYEKPMRLNLVVLYYKIIEKPKKKIVGKKFNLRGVSVIDFVHVFAEGKVTFRIFNNESMQVFMPETEVKAMHLRHTKKLMYEKAMVYANWFQKRFHCRLGLPEIRQDFHIAIEEKNPKLIELCNKHGVIKVMEDDKLLYWWDKSKGEVEFETREEEIAEEVALQPIKILWLKDKVEFLDNEVKMLKQLYNDGFDELNKKLDDINNDIKKILEVKEGKPDEKLDVV